MMWNWFKEKWKLAVGIVSAFVAGLFVFLRFKNRSQEHKENFKNAKDAHAAEMGIERDSREKLESGLDKIDEDAQKKIEDIEKDSEVRNRALDREKHDFVEDAKESDDLAEKIADAIGADFVEN